MNDSKTIQRFFTLYHHKISEEQRAILRLKALLYYEVPLSTLQTCFSHLTYLFPIKKTGAFIACDNHLKTLKNLKMLDAESKIPPEVIHRLTLDVTIHEHAEDYWDCLIKTSAKMGDRFYNRFYGGERKQNQLRLAVYKNQESIFRKLLEDYPTDQSTALMRQFFLTEPLDMTWLTTRLKHAQGMILYVKMNHFCLTGEQEDQIPSLLNHYQPLREQVGFDHLDQSFLWYDLLAGDVIKTRRTLERMGETLAYAERIEGMLLVMENKPEQALVCFESALKQMKKDTRKKKLFLGVQESLFYSLAVLQIQNRTHYPKLQEVLSHLGQYDVGAFPFLEQVLWQLQGLESKSRHLPLRPHKLDPLSSAVATLAQYWMNPQTVNKENCIKEFVRYKETLPLVAKIFAEILVKEGPDKAEYSVYLAQERFQGIVSFVDMVKVEEPWKRALNHLQHFLADEGTSASSSKRLVWLLDPQTREIDVLEQSLSVKGIWSKGRSVALKRLKEDVPKIDYLTPEDQKVIQTLRLKSGYSWGYAAYEWDPLQTPLSLVGHPRLYLQKSPSVKIELSQGMPELTILHHDEAHLHITLSHCEQDIVIEQETLTRYRVIAFPQNMKPLKDILGNKGLIVPLHAQEHILALMKKTGQAFALHSDLETEGLPSQPGDTTPSLQLIPFGAGLKAQLLIRPFKDQGPYFLPGEGRAAPVITLEGQPLQAKRSFIQEKAKVKKLIQACPVLSTHKPLQGEWTLEEPEDCLELLSQIQECSENVKLEWPEGQKFSLLPLSSKSLSLTIRHSQDWFAVDGTLTIDEDKVLELQQILALLDHAKGRFIPLENNTFLALTEHFKKQLQNFKALAEESKEGTRIHGFGSAFLKEFAEQAGSVTGDKAWIKRLKSFKEVETLNPELPSSLHAELREYQKDGFVWISRLAHLNFGACLADDMGLGKTVQAIAVLLTKAEKGPCLIIAPTSVCYNWILELKKFAPSLTPYLFAEENRADRVAQMKPQEVLICSYTLLQQEEEILTSREWQMIVLDEAQAIKNPATRRFQAAVKLKGQFKLALTGTPIENSLEELWSLCRFILPGLLGSRGSFQKRFMAQDAVDARRGLKKLMGMFILRRTKDNVLTELPPRIEKTILIDMSAEEAAFYEALKRRALENVQNLEEEGGKRKIHILAEITRLRRACCHPSLAQKDIQLSSSKLSSLMHLMDELLQNNHQALIFSQFVQYLKMVRQELDQKGVPYQYLDGSTPSSERQKQVQEFQEGKSPFFLLSLKAGGTGLNLTAADYVIHLDPWWNPAVEDQASDRAHRMGQTRPVTIYRLILRHTIEEKILALHQEKREMAHELLSENTPAAHLSEQELLTLMGMT